MTRMLVIALFVLFAHVAAAGPSTITIAPPDEAGERLDVSGVVTDDQGKPVAGAEVYVYQTDASGKYRHSLTGKRELAGTAITDTRGRYLVSTIRPGSYPGERILAHIHYEVEAKGYAKKELEIVFEDDPLLDDTWRRRIAGNAAFQLRPIAKDKAGVWQTTADITLQRR